jgi:tyrosine-protein phosphatase SIW14
MLLVIVLTALVAQALPAEAPAGAKNYTRINASFACAGATEATAFPALAKDGFRSVINLRTDGEEGADIEAARKAAAAAGLRFIHIPFSGASPDASVLDRFLAQVGDPANQPAYIHCASANRASAAWLVKRVMLDGWPVARAVDEAEKLGLKSDKLKAFAVGYLAAHGRM